MTSMLSDAVTASTTNAAARTRSPAPYVIQPDEGEDEMFIIVERQYRVFAGGQWNDASPGTVVYLPAGAMHTFHVTGGRDGKHWVLNTSPDFREYYTRVGDIVAPGGFPDPARLNALGAEYGMYIIRPDAKLAEALAAR